MHVCIVNLSKLKANKDEKIKIYWGVTRYAHAYGRLCFYLYAIGICQKRLNKKK